MIAVVQRVSGARVRVERGEGAGHDVSIGRGLLALVCAEAGDGESEAVWVADKIANLRIFEDEGGKMNISALGLEPRGEVLVISQFTLAGDVRKGHRPSFVRAAGPEDGRRLVACVSARLREAHGLKVGEGVFGGEMRISLVNEGPVTIIIERRAADSAGA
ncbi:MAG: D-aminoacyl-tRNA deacylase [Phycisphaerales bacterium]